MSLIDRWSDLSRLTKFAVAVGAVSGALVSTATAYSMFVGWVPASRGYMADELRPIMGRLLFVHRRVNKEAIFAWETNHPEPRPHEIQTVIDDMKDELADIDRLIAEMRTRKR